MRNCHPVSIVAIRVWIPSNSVQGFPFLYILTRTFYLLSLIIAILTKVRWFSLWFGFVFPWWLVTLSMFSCSCWPFVYIFSLGKKCHSGCSLLIFQYDYLFFSNFFLLLYEFLKYFEYEFLIRYMVCRYILPFFIVAFSFCWLHILLCRNILVWCNSTCWFLLLMLVLLVSHPDIITKTNVKENFTYFFQGILHFALLQ